jgi:hypothetical protein
MPKFTQQPIPVKTGRPKGIPQEVVDEYKPYIEQIEKGNEGTLEFGKNENITQGRKALVEAGIQLKKYVKVRKPRGQDNVLTFSLITKKEFDEAKEKAAARGAKLKGKPRAKRKKS